MSRSVKGRHKEKFENAFTFDSEGSVGTPKSSHCPETGA